jgi:Domain of unknown function (DUF6894)
MSLPGGPRSPLLLSFVQSRRGHPDERGVELSSVRDLRDVFFQTAREMMRNEELDMSELEGWEVRVEMPFELFKDVPYVGAKAVFLDRLSFHPKTFGSDPPEVNLSHDIRNSPYTFRRQRGSTVRGSRPPANRRALPFVSTFRNC